MKRYYCADIFHIVPRLEIESGKEKVSDQSCVSSRKVFGGFFVLGINENNINPNYDLDTKIFNENFL